jgi:hypothetical protein
MGIIYDSEDGEAMVRGTQKVPVLERLLTCCLSRLSKLRQSPSLQSLAKSFVISSAVSSLAVGTILATANTEIRTT